jgi:hypothetical protein
MTADPAGGARELGFKGLERHGLRLRVRHLDEAGDANGHGGLRLGRKIGLLGGPRPAEMDLVVDHSRHEHTTRGVEDLYRPGIDLAADLDDSAVLELQITLLFGPTGHS